MRDTPERRLAKWLWAKNHPDKVRQANRNYRRWNADHVRDKTRDRMRRWRARHRHNLGPVKRVLASRP